MGPMVDDRLFLFDRITGSIETKLSLFSFYQIWTSVWRTAPNFIDFGDPGTLLILHLSLNNFFIMNSNLDMTHWHEKFKKLVPFISVYEACIICHKILLKITLISWDILLLERSKFISKILF